MFETIDKSDKAHNSALREDLERRYGPGMAQDILDQLAKAESPGTGKGEAGYLSVKTLSEAEELYRREAQIALKRLREWKCGADESIQGVVEFEGAFLQKDFERSFSFYRRFHKGYHVLYRQAMQAYKVKAYVPAHKIDQNNTVLQAA